MICEDIYYIIASYLLSIKDIISLHNVNKTSRLCKYNIILQSKRPVPNFIYEEFNIVKLTSTFTDYSQFNKLLTDKLLSLSISYSNKDDLNILNKLPELTNLQTLRIHSSNLDNSMLVNLINLVHLDLGQYRGDNLNGIFLCKLQNLTYLNLAETFIESKYVNNLTRLVHLFINTKINDDDFSLLTNLKTLDVSKSEYTLSDSNIKTLTNLINIKCKYSAITNINHLQLLEVLYLGVNFTLKKIICNSKLKILSIIDSNVNELNVPSLLELTLNNDIKDEILCIHTKLTNLYFGENICVTDNGINTLTNLRYIHCNINRNITSYGFINISKLIYLHAGMSYINIDKLSHLVNLQYVEQYESYLGNLESVIVLDNRYSIK